MATTTRSRPVHVWQDADFVETGRAEKRRDRSPLGRSDFDQQPPARHQPRPGPPRNRAVGVQPVAAGGQRQMRLPVTHFGREARASHPRRCRVGLTRSGRTPSDAAKTSRPCGTGPGLPAPGRGCCPSPPQGGSENRSRPARHRHSLQAGQQDATCPGAGPALLQEGLRQRFGHQALGLGTRVQDIAGHAERVPPEQSPPGMRHRLACDPRGQSLIIGSPSCGSVISSGSFSVSRS